MAAAAVDEWGVGGTSWSDRSRDVVVLEFNSTALGRVDTEQIVQVAGDGAPAGDHHRLASPQRWCVVVHRQSDRHASNFWRAGVLAHAQADDVGAALTSCRKPNVPLRCFSGRRPNPDLS